MEKESPHTEAKNFSELVLEPSNSQDTAGHKSMLERHHSPVGSPKNTYSGKEAAQHMTENNSCRFFSKDTGIGV